MNETARQPGDARRARWWPKVAAALLTAAALAGFLALVGRHYVPPYQPPIELSAGQESVYRQIAGSITEEGVGADLAALCARESRAIGTPGYEEAIQLIRTRFERAGLRHVNVLRLPVAVPVTKRAELHLDGVPQEPIRLFPLWPNLVRTCSVPTAGIEGPLIDAGDGRLANFDGADAASAIVLLDADCDSRWLNAPLLGGAAVIFCGADKLTREQAEVKSLTTPVNVPRFLVRDADARRLRLLAAGAGAPRARLFSTVTIENRDAAIVTGVLDGADDRVSGEALVLEAHFDSLSEVPDLAPGAEAACGMAGLLQAADRLASNRPRRSVVFVANGAHFDGQGMERLLLLLGRRLPNTHTSVTTAREVEAREAALRDARARLEGCRAEAALLPAAGSGAAGLPDSQAGPAEWTTVGGELQEQLVRDIQMSVKAVLDEAWEREIRDPAAGKMPPRRRLTLQKICWESKLENLRTTHWQEAAGALGILRERVRRREEGLAARIGRLEREIAFLRSLRALNLRLFLGLDLSSGSDSFGIFERGNPDGPPYEGRGPVSPFADRLSAIAERIEGLCGLLAEGRPRSLPPFVNSFKPLKNLDPRSCLAAMMKFDMEACYASNRTAGTFCTMSDPRPWVATPNDTLERVDVPNVARQVRLMVPMLKALLDAAEPLAGESDLHDHSGTATVHALTVPRGGAIVPDHPVDGAIIVDKATDQVRNAWYLNIKPYACGVRENHVAIADEEGAAVFPTGWHEVFTQPPRPFEAYRLDADTGEIVYALDRGVSGAQKFSNEIILDRARKQGTLVLFRCQPVGLFDLVDPRYMSLLRRIDVLAAEDDSPPLQFGYNLSTQPAGGYETETAGESCAVVYLEPGKKFKATMSAGIIGLRLALLNMPDVEAGCRGKAPPLQPRPSLPSPSLGRGWGGGFGRCPAPTGEGYAPDATARLPLTPWLIARDMWRLDEVRIRNLNARGISNELLERLHLQAGERLRLARAALDARRYSAALAHAREAWAYESRAYPLVRSAADDAIKGIVFYLFLLLPFAFFAERLLFSFPKILHRILGAVGVFLAVFLVLRFTHPAFKLTTSPAMVLLAFITLALAIVVIFLLGGKVADQLRRLRQREGARSVDVNRFSTLRAAFMLGIGNLRKRPVRTGLTAATLVLMSFTVVSFTSVKFVPRYNKLDTNEAAPYDGILVKRPQWSAVDSQVHDGIEALYGGQYAVVPRGWFIGYTQLSIPGRPAPAVKVVPKPDAQGPPAAPEHAWPVVPTMMGLDVREPEVTGVDAFLSAGRWFSSSDASECILPTELAETLELSPADAGRVSIEACGQELLVVGIVDSQRLGALLDLNGEPVTPIDTTIVQTTSKSKEETLADHYRHFLPQDTILVPYRRLQAFGRSAAGTFRLASVAVAMGSGESGTAVVKAAAETAAEEVIRRYMTSKAVNLYVGIGGRSYFYSVPGMLSFSGLRNVALPLAIAALIVLNTMLGAVYERFKDIYIFSAIGLAPSHIGTLFLAESCVFATIGGVAGYLMGQIFSVVFIRTGLLGGLTLNYSSGSVVTAMLVVMAVVVLSSLYPAHKASRLASPAIDRKWTLPQEEADRVAVELPFNVEERDAEGLLAFIAHYFLAHREAGVGSFTSSDVSCERSGGGVLRLRAHVWMAPYDLGVSQSVGIEVAPPDEAGIRAVHLELLRESGEPRSWRKTSFILLDGLRKQFLRWRTVPEAERRRRAEEFQAFCRPS